MKSSAADLRSVAEQVNSSVWNVPFTSVLLSPLFVNLKPDPRQSERSGPGTSGLPERTNVRTRPALIALRGFTTGKFSDAGADC